MARQANILSFDEAKRDIGMSRRSAEYARSRTRFADDIPSFESPFRQMPPARTGSVPAHARARSTAVAGRTTSGRSASAGYSTRSVAPAPQTSERRRPRHASMQNGTPSWLEDDFIREPRAAATRAQEPAEEATELKRSSRFAKFRREHAKDKAERKFTKQYGSSDASDASQTGSRAAVYKGEMGAKHRQAARMQNAASPNASSKRGFSFGSLASLKSSPKFIASAAVAACLVLSCLFLYPAAQQYYHAVRENDRLTAEYAALADRNESLEGTVSSLQTDSGIEQVAHEQFGWVKPGEETANVRGLELSEEESSFRANITPGSVEAPETWYSQLLDPLFGAE